MYRGATLSSHWLLQWLGSTSRKAKTTCARACLLGSVRILACVVRACVLVHARVCVCLRERRVHRRAPVHDVRTVVEDAVVVTQPDDRRVGRVERRELLTSRVEEGERPDLSVLEVHLSSSSSITTAPEGGLGRART